MKPYFLALLTTIGLVCALIFVTAWLAPAPNQPAVSAPPPR
jgi:hypothetical protein